MAWDPHEKYGSRTIYFGGGEGYRVAVAGYSKKWFSASSLDAVKRFLNDWDTQKADEKKKKYGTTTVTLGVAVNGYLKGKLAKDPTKKFKPDHTYAKHLISFFGAGTKMDAIQYPQMVKFFDESPNVGKYDVSAKIQVKCFLTSLQKFCKRNGYYTGWDGWLHEIMYKKSDCTYENASDRISLNDLLKLLDVTEKTSKWWTLYRLMMAYGFRPQELRDVRRCDWNSEERSLHIVIQKVKHIRDRKIYVVKELAEEIDAILASHDRPTIFVNGKNQKIGVNAIFHDFKARMVKAGIPVEKYSPYSIRKFAARNLYLKYRDLAKVAHLLGHSMIVADVYYKYDINEERMDEEIIWWDFESDKKAVKSTKATDQMTKEEVMAQMQVLMEAMKKL